MADEYHYPGYRGLGEPFWDDMEADIIAAVSERYREDEWKFVPILRRDLDDGELAGYVQEYLDEGWKPGQNHTWLEVSDAGSDEEPYAMPIIYDGECYTYYVAGTRWADTCLAILTIMEEAYRASNPHDTDPFVFDGSGI